MMTVLRGLLLILLFISLPSGAKQAHGLFKEYGSALVQITSVNIDSGQKSSIGTGFYVSDSGKIVTNYHVISSYVQSPKRFVLSATNEQQQKFDLKVVAVDVINDLAVLSSSVENPVNFFSLSPQSPSKGSEIFALGNPHDLGMIVVPGTYNGIKARSFNQRIHFTGAINPGMSGGPTVNGEGQVVGINVATAGNQIGFLVPVNKLASLLRTKGQRASVEHSVLLTEIGTQVAANQHQLVTQLLDKKWQTYQFGQAQVPKEIATFMPCWGRSSEQKQERLYQKTEASCGVDEYIYLSDQHTTGQVQMRFTWIETDSLNSIQLSNLLQAHLNQRLLGKNAGQEEVSNYHCNQQLVSSSKSSQSKAYTCVRGYQKYNNLFDVHYHSVLLKGNNQALVAKYVLQGVEQVTAELFYQAFMENVTWN